MSQMLGHLVNGIWFITSTQPVFLEVFELYMQSRQSIVCLRVLKFHRHRLLTMTPEGLETLAQISRILKTLIELQGA